MERKGQSFGDMSKTSFQVDRELNVHGKGTLSNALRQLEGEVNLGKCLTKSIAVYQSIDQEYKKAMANDGKIVGKERTDILEQIDLFMDMLILLWRTLDEEKRREILIAIGNKQTGFHLNITEKNQLWEAEGTLNQIMVRPVKNFRDIYNNKLAPEIIDLLKKYGQATEDGVIDIEEINILKRGVKQVLYYTLFLRFQLEKCLINA